MSGSRAARAFPATAERCFEALARWDACYEHATQRLSLNPRPALLGMSRGGLIVFRWAAKNPDKVACIYVDAPVCDIRSWPGGKGTGKGSARTWNQCLKAHGITEEQSSGWRGNPIHRLEPLAKADPLE